MTRTLTLLALVFVLAASTVAAQDFTATVTQDPNAGLAIYDIKIDGPPRGTAWVWVGTGLLPGPLPFGNIGPLYLDPLSMFPLGLPFPLDRQGKGALTIALPIQMTASLPLHFQSVVIDSANTTVLIPNYWTLMQGVPRRDNPNPEGFAFAYEEGSKDVHFQSWGQNGDGKNIQIFDEQQRLIGTVQVTNGANNKSPVITSQLKKSLKPGYTYQVWERQGNQSVMIDKGQF